MRTKDWRIYKKETKMLRRIKNQSNRHQYHRFIDANNNILDTHRWMDYIGTRTHFMYKSYTTDSRSSEWKLKWGKKGKKSHYEGFNNRISDKRRFKRMLESDYGIKHFNVSYGLTQDNTE
jgi:hypothetical protein